MISLPIQKKSQLEIRSPRKTLVIEMHDQQRKDQTDGEKFMEEIRKFKFKYNEKEKGNEPEPENMSLPCALNSDEEIRNVRKWQDKFENKNRIEKDLQKSKTKGTFSSTFRPKGPKKSLTFEKCLKICDQ